QGRGPLVEPSLARSMIFLHVLLIVCAVPLMTFAALITERRAVQELFIKSRRELIDAHDRERHRFAQMLQGDIAQRATIMEVELERVGREPRAGRNSPLTNIQEQVGEISKSVLGLAEDLHPFALDYLGLIPALKRLCYSVDAGIMEVKLVEQ